MSSARQIEERAALWLLHREELGWSAADQAEFDDWLAQSDAHKAAFWRLEYGWGKADRIASLGASIHPVRRIFRTSSWATPMALAASLVLLLSFIFLTQRPRTFTPTPQATAMRVETAIGGHRLVSLPDGSRVELNTDTAIRTIVNDRSRTVWLERGEAFFDIAKQHGQKFVIYAGSRTVTVLGTKFSVRREPRELVVAVLEGRVRLDPQLADASGRAMVAAGNVAIANGRNTFIRNSTEAVQQELAWRTGQLVFHDVTLASAVEQFNRYNQTQLAISDPELAQRLIDGTFVARNVGAFVQMLRNAYGLDIENSAGKITLSGDRMASQAMLNQLRPSLSIAKPKNLVGDNQCGRDGGDCALLRLLPAIQEVAPRNATQDQPAREASNWDVLYKLYPPRALAAREEGLVGFTVKIDGSGNPASCKITHSSGHPLLDLETCELIMVHATFNRVEGVSRSQQRSYEGVVNWRLPPTPQASAGVTPKAIVQSDAPEQMICKRILKTGSNAEYERTCMTTSDWERKANEVRSDWEPKRSQI